MPSAGTSPPSQLSSRSSTVVLRQRFFRPDHHLRRAAIDADDVKRLVIFPFAVADIQAAPLADRVMDDAFVTAQHVALPIDDFAGIDRAGRSLATTLA